MQNTKLSLFYYFEILSVNLKTEPLIKKVLFFLLITL